MLKTFLLALTLVVVAPSFAQDEEDHTAPAAEAELSDDQSQAAPEVELTDEQAAAARAQVLPMIKVGSTSAESIDRGTLCHSQFAQRSPICAASR